MSGFVSGEEAAARVQAGALLFDTRGTLQRLARPLRGSVAYAWKDWRAGPGRTGLLPEDLGPLQAWLAAHGLRPDRDVVVAGGGGQGWGEEARLAWTLEVLGHPAVALVDGGADSLRRAGPATGATPRVTPRAARALLADVRAAIADRTATLWDVRTPAEWAGAKRYGEARGGHLPGARALPIASLFDDAGFLRSRPQVTERLAAGGVPMDQPVIAYCTGGVRSALACSVLTHLGHTQALNYDGGVWEWSTEPDLPLL